MKYFSILLILILFSLNSFATEQVRLVYLNSGHNQCGMRVINNEGSPDFTGPTGTDILQVWATAPDDVRNIYYGLYSTLRKKIDPTAVIDITKLSGNCDSAAVVVERLNAIYKRRETRTEEISVIETTEEGSPPAVP